MFDRSKWVIKTQDPELVSALADSLKISPVCARLLINRGYTDPISAQAFLEKTDSELYDPYLLCDMDKAVRRTEEALKYGEKITIYGDYDVDGVTSVSIMYMYLHEHGASVDSYIPARENEGYGLNFSAIDSIAKSGTTLIITVDTGITATEDVKYAKSIGVDIIITDHHQCRSDIPLAEAVVNPKRPDCEYPFKELSGVGVAFKLICALELSSKNNGSYDKSVINDMCKQYIDLVTIGTIADVMPLVGENRIIVSSGLKMLQNTQKIGIRALFKATGIDYDNPKKITSSFIGYTIAPRINAVGRIGNAGRAVQLFLAESPKVADIIADELCNTNRRRQELENEIFLEAVSQIEKEHNISNENVIVLSSDHWHHGVIGIVASRLTERYNLPSVLISFEGDGVIGKGSARSVKGLNLASALAACSDTLCKYGGHELAAGLTVERDKLNEFKKKLSEYTKEHLDRDESIQKTVIDAEIESDEINEDTVRAVSRLDPFGAGNATPLFIFKNAMILQVLPLSMGKHSKLILTRDGESFTTLFFGANIAELGFSQGDEVDILCGIDINEFRGMKSIQLIARDIDYSDEAKTNLCEMQKECDEFIFEGRTPFLSDVPNKSECSAIYRGLISALGGDIGVVTIKQLISSGSSSYIKTGVALAAFKQLDFISIEKISLFEYKITIRKFKEKKDIFAAPIMSGKAR